MGEYVRSALNPRERLTGPQWAAIASLAIGSTEEQAAKHAGVSAVTITRWKRKNPAFRPAVREMSRELAERTVDRLHFAAQASINELLRLIANPRTREENKIRAAQVLLSKIDYAQLSAAGAGEPVPTVAAPAGHLFVVTDDTVARVAAGLAEIETERQLRLVREGGGGHVIAGEIEAP